MASVKITYKWFKAPEHNLNSFFSGDVRAVFPHTAHLVWFSTDSISCVFCVQADMSVIGHCVYRVMLLG